MSNLGTLTAKSYRILLYDELEEYESAIEVLTQHLARNPTDGIAYNNRGLACSEIGRGEEALLDLERAIEFSSGDPIPFVNRGNLYERVRPIGDFDKAIEDYSRAIAIDPNNPTFHRCKAHACLKMERLEDAIESFSNAIRLDSEFRQTYVDRGRAYERLGRKQEAKLDFDRANKLPTFRKR